MNELEVVEEGEGARSVAEEGEASEQEAGLSWEEDEEESVAGVEEGGGGEEALER